MKRTNFNFPAISGKLLQKATGSIVVAAALLLSGCAVHNASVSAEGTPFYLAYDSEEIIRNQSQVATITSTLGLEIDGIEVNSKNMRSTTESKATKSVVVVDVLPGEHQVRLVNTQVQLEAVQASPITYNFEAGHIYDVTVMMILVKVYENTSADVAQKIAVKRNNAVFERRNK